MKNMYLILTQMLQGCSKRNGMTVSASGSDGAQTSEVKRQTLSSKKEKWSKNEALSSTCLRSASDALSFRSRYLRYAAMMALLLTLVCGKANAWYYITGDPVGGWKYDAPAGGKMNSSNNITFMAMAAGTYYFKLYCDGWGNPCGSINSASGTAYDSSGKQSGDCGAMWVKTNDVSNITFQVVNSDQVNITVTKCAYYIKYKWNNGTAAWSGDMKSNGDGTYSVMGQYGGNKFRYGRKDSDGGADYSDSDQTATVVGSPSNGNWCIFTYTPASHSLEIRKCNSITKTNHIYFDNENANWTPTYLYFVIGRPYKESDKYSKMYRIQQITNTKLWYVANSADTWSDAGYYAIAGGSSAWDKGTNWNYDALSGWAKYSAPYLSKFDMANGDIVAVTKADNTIGGAISMTKRGTSGSLNSALNNLTITYKYSLSRDGGSTYSDMTSDMCKTPCSLQMDWYKFSNCSTATKQTAKTTSANGTSYTNNTGSNAGYRAAITMTHGTPVATGYTFVCWHDGTNSLGTSNPFTFYPAATMTVEARFKANAYSVKFNKNDDGATGTMSNQTHYYGTSKALTSCGFTAPSGKVFAGWATSPSGPVVYSNGESVTNLSSTDGATVNLYAVWAYSLTYNCDGAESGCPSTGVGLTLPDPLPGAPFKPGYNFDGWYTNSAKTISAVAGADIAANTTLHAKWTQVYATTMNFAESETRGTDPNDQTLCTKSVDNKYCDHDAFRVDNYFFSATKLQYETGNASDKYNGWKFQYSGSTIKFFVENDCSVAVAMGANAGCSIKYTPIDGSETTENLSTSDNQTTTKDVEGGTMVTLTTTSGSTVTLKSITITDKASCTTPTIAWSTSPTNGNVGGNMTISVTSNYPAGVTITSNNSNATLTDRTVAGSTVSYTLNYAVAGNANITASVDGDGSTVCDETVNLDAVAITISKNTPTSYTVSGGGSYCPGQGQVCLDDSQDDISYQLYRGESKVGEAMEGSGSGICWLNLSEAGTYTVKAVENATYAAATMSGNAVITFKTNTAIETQPSSVAHANVGSAASLSGLLATGTSLSYQWQTCNSDGTGAVDINTGTNPSAATATLSITPASAGVTYYKCVVSGGCGAPVTSNVVSITAKNTISPTLSYDSYSVLIGGTLTATLDKKGSDGSVTYESSDDDVATVASDGTVTGVSAGTVTITATIADGTSHWGNTATSSTITVSAPTYTVTYDAQGGSVTPTSETVSTATLPTPTKSGYTFQGWYTSGGTLISGTYNPTADITLHALWREDECSGGGGGGSSTVYSMYLSGTNGKSDVTITQSTAGVASISYVLDDSSPMDVGGLKYFKFGSSSSITLNYTFVVGDKLVFDLCSKDDNKNCGVSVKVGSADAVEVTGTINQTPSTLEYTMSSAGSQTIVIKRAGTNDSSMRLHGITITRSGGGGSGTCYYVTYNGNGADGGFTKDEASHPSGSNVTVKTNSFTKTGYTFTGWKTEPSGGTSYAAGGTISSIADNMILYAQWIESGSTYDITYHCNDATSGCPDNATGQVALPDPLATPTKTNYSFGGWYTNVALSSEAVAGATLDGDADLYAKWTQTITLKTGTQGSGADKTPTVVWQGTALNGFSAHAADGYTLQGYYTAGSGGVKVLNADGTFAAANVTDYITSSKWSRTGAAPTLFAQWVATEDCRTLKYAWKATGKFCDDESTSVTSSDTVRFPANASNLYFTESGTGNTVSAGSSYNIGKTKDNYFLLTAKSGYQIKSICFYGKVQDSSVDYTTDNSTWTELESTKTDGDDYYSFNGINASHFGIKLTATSPKGIWIRNMVIEVCAAGGTTYNVTYDGNDKTGGTAPTDASSPYAYGATVTVLGNTGSLEKTNYTFAGWTTNDDGTGSSYEAGSTFSITDNTTLYAKWTQSVTLNKNGGSTDGSATAVWNATGLTGITHAKPAAGYKLLGYYSASSDGTKVLNSDGSFAATNVTGYITSGKWSRTSATTLYAEYESAGALTWNLIVDSDTANLSTSTKTSAFTEISTTNMTNAALVGGLTYDKSKKKSSLTGKISTPASYDADKYVYVTFQVASGYKFTPSSIKVIAQPVTTGKDVKLSLTDGAYHSLVSSSATSISGGSTQTVTLAGDGTYFTGTVTLKIYCYGATDAYRLGTPITIEGEIEEACATMPSYTSMSYTTTTFAPNADASGSPITIVGGDNINTYQWKYNTVNDRTSGNNCGTNNASLTPLTDAGAAIDGTRYYWCEMTNGACGITIKSPAVAITVAAAKSDATVAWTDPASTPNYGGGGYTIKATVNETEWNGNAADLVITAPAGINIYNVTS